MTDLTHSSKPTICNSRPTDIEIIDALADAAAGQLTPEAATALRKRLTNASAARTVARSISARAAGAKEARSGALPTKSGRPPTWYAVEERSKGSAVYTQHLQQVAEWLGISKGSLDVYMNRGGGTYERLKDVGDYEEVVTVRRCTEKELAALQEFSADPVRAAEIPLWQPPETEEHNPKKLTSRKPRE